jgi:hypothetical protein
LKKKRDTGSRVLNVRVSVAATAERILPGRMARLGRPFIARLDTLLFAEDKRGEAGRMAVLLPAAAAKEAY